MVALFHLLCLSTAIYTRTDSGVLGGTEPRDIVRYVAELIVCINCLINLIMQVEEIRSQGMLGFLKNQVRFTHNTYTGGVSLLLCFWCYNITHSFIYDLWYHNLPSLSIFQ